MAWPWRYAIRVEGLDNVGILFLPNAMNDEDARATIALCDKADRRRTTEALYRIECIIDELNDKDSEPLPVVRGRRTRGLFLHTGTLAKKMCSSLFAAESVPDAIETARKREWQNIRLYQCEEVPR